jgi:hypothetical protein
VPREQMHHQHLEPTPKFPLVSFAQAFDFLGDTLRVNRLPLAGADQRGRGLRLLKQILLVELGIRGHGVVLQRSMVDLPAPVDTRS